MSERKLLFLMTAEQAAAFERLVEAAERGDGDAACRLGDMYREGLGGLRYSPKETFRWYSRSALAGDANGQNNLGACYEHGLGCVQSYANAVKWYRRAMAQGLGTASMNLGYCHLRGHGVAADRVEALRLFREAVERGEEDAAREVAVLERRSRPRPMAVADTTPRANSGGCSASSTGTPGAPPCELALGCDATLLLRCNPAGAFLHRRSPACVLTLPHDGLPRRLQPPDPARGQSRMVPREQHQRSETGTTPGIDGVPQRLEPPNSAPTQSPDVPPRNLGAADVVARPEPDAAAPPGERDSDPCAGSSVAELLPRTVSRQEAKSEPPGRDPRRVRGASFGAPETSPVRFVDATEAGKHFGLVDAAARVDESREGET